MEATKAAAVSLFQFAIRTTIGDHYPPPYTHYLPLRMTGKDGHLKPLIQHLTPRAGPTASHPSTAGEGMFIIRNEFKVEAGPNGGIHAYVTPNDYDLCPDESAYYPIGTQVKAMMYSENWIQILGKVDVPNDIKVKQAAMFAHAIPYWREYERRLQLVREAEEASRPQPQLASQDAPFTGPTAGVPLMLYPNPLADVATPTSRGPVGLPPLMGATGRPITYESYAMDTPATSPIRQQRIDKSQRAQSAMPWRRSTSCSDRRQRSAASCIPDTGAEPVDFADFASTNPALRHRFTFGGTQERPESEIPRLPLAGLPGFVMVNGQEAMPSSERDRRLTAQDVHLNHKRDTLFMEKEHLRRET